MDIKIIKGTNVQITYTVKTLVNPLLPYDPVSNVYETVDLTPYTATLSARTSYDQPALITLTSAVGITLNSDGTLVIDFTPADTNSIEVNNNQGRRLFYDLNLYLDQVCNNVLNGNIYVLQNF